MSGGSCWPSAIMMILLCESEFLPQRPFGRQAREHEDEQVRAVPQWVLDEAALPLADRLEPRGERVELLERQELPAGRAGDAAQQLIVARHVRQLRLVARGDAQ